MKPTETEIACFESGVKLGSLYHQFSGVPISLDNIKNLSSAIEKSIENKRPYLNVNKIDLEKVSNKIIQYKVNRSKEKEIDDHILRQTLFLFNLELWHQIFIDSKDLKNQPLSLEKLI